MGLNPQVKVEPGSANRPVCILFSSAKYLKVCGYDVQIFAEHSEEEQKLTTASEKYYPAPVRVMGKLALKLPLPPGSLLTIYNDDMRFKNSYLSEIPGYYLSGGIISSLSYIYIIRCWI